VTRALEGGPIRVLASPGGGGTDGNPYIDLLHQGVAALGVEVTPFDRRRLLAARDVVHVHWPAALVRWDSAPRAIADAAKVLGGLAVARLRGARLVWTGHDLEPHELRHPLLHRWYFAAFIRMVDLWISLTPAGAAALQQRYPVLQHRALRVVPHGSYRDAYPGGAERQGLDRRGAERALDLPPARRSYLLLGQIRPYKQVPALLRAFAADADPDARLLVVGEVRGDPHLADAARAAAPSGAVLRLERVPGAQIPLWHAAADVVVLPYDTRSALNSGALLLALSLDTPVVVADSPINRELRQQVGADWVHLFDGGPAEALAVAKRVAHARRSGRPDLDAFAWPAIAEATVQAYRDVLGVVPSPDHQEQPA
jgi:glycosyltransferase involved in cell wall biosynthesis